MVDLEALADSIESRLTNFPPLGANEVSVRVWCKTTLPSIHASIDEIVEANRKGELDEKRHIKRRLQNMATSVYYGEKSLPEAAVLVRRFYAKPDGPELAERLRALLRELEGELRQLAEKLKKE